MTWSGIFFSTKLNHLQNSTLSKSPGALNDVPFTPEERPTFDRRYKTDNIFRFSLYNGHSSIDWGEEIPEIVIRLLYTIRVCIWPFVEWSIWNLISFLFHILYLSDFEVEINCFIFWYVFEFSFLFYICLKLITC